MILESILLNVNMGLGLIDENLDGLMEYFADVPLTFSMFGIAKAVGACIAVGLAGYEAYMMMLGKRGIDALKIVRILLLAICIGQSDKIAAALQQPGELMMQEARAIHDIKYEEVMEKEKEAAQMQEEYVAKLREVIDSVRQANITASFTDFSHLEHDSWWETAASQVMGGVVSEHINHIASTVLSEYGKEGAAVSEQFLVETISYVIRFIGEIVFQMIYYAMLVTQRIVLYLMTLFLPLAFALSLAPPYKSAWSQFIAKFLSITLWGFVIYVMMFFIDHILYYFIELDIHSYEALLREQPSGSWTDVGLLGIKGIGTCAMYVTAMLIGAKVLSMAPEVASWMIPGGVSSSAGSMAGGIAAGAVGGAAAGAVTAAKAGVGTASGTAHMAVGGTAAAMKARREGASPLGALAHGVFSQTSFGKAADAGAKSSASFGNWGERKKGGSPRSK